MKNNIELTLKPAVLFNTLRAVAGAVIAAAGIYAEMRLNAVELQTIEHKIICVACFLAVMIVIIAGAGTFICSLMNIVSRPTVRLDNEKIAVLNRPAISLADIISCKLIPEKKMLLLICADGTETVIKQRFINIPLRTLKEAVDLRKGKV